MMLAREPVSSPGILWLCAHTKTYSPVSIEANFEILNNCSRLFGFQLRPILDDPGREHAEHCRTAHRWRHPRRAARSPFSSETELASLDGDFRPGPLGDGLTRVLRLGQVAATRASQRAEDRS